MRGDTKEPREATSEDRARGSCCTDVLKEKKGMCLAEMVRVAASGRQERDPRTRPLGQVNVAGDLGPEQLGGEEVMPPAL